MREILIYREFNPLNPPNSLSLRMKQTRLRGSKNWTCFLLVLFSRSSILPGTVNIPFLTLDRSRPRGEREREKKACILLCCLHCRGSQHVYDAWWDGMEGKVQTASMCQNTISSLGQERFIQISIQFLLHQQRIRERTSRPGFLTFCH